MAEIGVRHVMVIVGTRPEAVKMAPVIKALCARPETFRCTVVSTGQHREMLRQTLTSFGLSVDVDLDIMQPDQTLASLTGAAIGACEKIFQAARPDVVLVQGDTTTVLSASLAAHYAQIPVGHVEAGLRTYERYNPFPEEMNRKLVTSLATLHFAPTERSARQLRKEGVPPSKVFVTGNTVVDALEELRGRVTTGDVSPAVRERVARSQGRFVLVTCHRRESFAHDLNVIVDAIAMLADRFPDHTFFFPVHLNPNVRALVMPRLNGIENVVLADPVPYADILFCLSSAELVLTDSGGLQEEAPSFGVPVIVLRRTTERPEGVRAGFSRLVPIEQENIVSLASSWLRSHRKAMLAGRPNPYGDGNAAARIVDILSKEPLR
ncbi:non-hydrolyzing UDP-N-acetylglucosamine 2-epimerase [Rhizobium miluonense]|uniref:UDP-N-acetylglucosamine 2-epimerase (non-hydrolyzing) n=1 Tax=Rhizobium miluonense TaxID=411945 RepID=A0A1C3W361_9HYPH|nr:UDP-N-acetylglucosamine 2-epimerase (non-hydrolyzing) [Rhizobium miluonense]SCB34311.1 UDP-N-Acetylglucosamine 2-epimerase [Rhizobium miluonense]